MKAWFHWLFAALLAAAFALVLAANGLPLDLPGQPGWPEALLILLAAAGTITALARQLPLQNVLLAAFVIALMGGAVHALGVTMGIPFGPFLFGTDAGPQLFNTLPWAMPLIWVVAVLNSRGVARLILRPWRKIRSYGFWLIGLTAALTMLFDLAFDPFASRVKHYWLWMPTKFPVAWQGAPLVNFLSWAAVALLMLALVTPALINKNPARRGAGFSSARRMARRDFALRDRVRGARNVAVRRAGRGHCRSGSNVRHSRRAVVGPRGRVFSQISGLSGTACLVIFRRATRGPSISSTRNS